MSLINAYGIGAGRSISGEQEDDSEKIRQRRLTAAQREEQSRRSAALRERFSLADAAEARRAMQLTTQAGPPEDCSDSEADARPPAPVRPEVAGKVTQRRLDANEVSASPRRPTDPARSAVPRQALPSNRALDQARDEHLDFVESEVRPGHGDSLRCELDEGDSLLASIKPAAERELSVVPKLHRLIDDLPSLRGANFADKFVSQIDDVLSAFRSDRSHRLVDGEEHELHATLEFLDGYVEASRLIDCDRQRVLQSIEAFRQELPVAAMTPSAIPAVLSVAASAAAAAQHVAERGRVTGAAERSVAGRSRASDDEKKALDPESEIEAEVQGLAASASFLSQPNPIRSSQSSLSKDADKRREETLVAVTVRSV